MRTPLWPAAALLLASVLALAFAFALTGCAGRASSAGTAAPTRRGVPPGEVTPAFQAMRSVLSRAQGDLAAGGGAAKDLAALRRRSPEIVGTGIALLRSSLPHDLQRANLPRFLEGRAAFGEALKIWTSAAASPVNDPLPDALQRLVDAYWGWVDAYKGLPPERSV